MKVIIELTEEQVISIGRQYFGYKPTELILEPNAVIEVFPADVDVEHSKITPKGYKYFPEHTRVKNGKKIKVKGSLRRIKYRLSKKKKNLNAGIKNYPTTDAQAAGRDLITKLNPGDQITWHRLEKHIHANFPTVSSQYSTGMVIKYEQKPPNSRLIKVGKGLYRRV